MSAILKRITKAFRRETSNQRVMEPLPENGVLIDKASPSTAADYMFNRPVDSFVRMSQIGVARIPIYTVPFTLAYQLAYNCDILRTVIRALIYETFRNGIEIVPRYVRKCMVCGTEYYEEIDACKICGSHKFYIPNPKNKQRLEKILRDANLNDESLIDVLMAIDFDLNVVDNAYLVVIKRYYFDEDGKVIGAEPMEIIRADPRYMQLIMSRDGRPAYNEEGQIAVFCLEHRDKLHFIDPDKYREEGAKCPLCGKQMYPAYYRFRRRGKVVYYTSGEVLHIKKFTYGLGYGYPPVWSILMKIITLLRQDYFIMMAYTLQRSPRGILVIKTLSRESVEKAWSYLTERARNNPWMIYPLIVEGDPRARNIVEWVDLSFKPQEFNLMEFRQELRRSIAALYGVAPIFMAEPGGGQRDTMQILVTNRAVELEQRIFNEKILPWLCRQLGIEDWQYRLVPAEMRDIEKQIRIQERKLELARKLQELGYKPKVVMRGGEIDIIIVPGGEKGETQYTEARTRLSEDIERRRQQKREYYYRRFEEETLEGEEPLARTRPRIGEQRLEGEPTSPREEMEGEATI